MNPNLPITPEVPNSSTRRQAGWIIGAVVIFLTLCLVHYLRGYYFWGISGFAHGNDDAFISFQYARNLVDHGVLSFNPDDSAYVEGFSNPLHVLLSAAIYLISGLDKLYPAVATLSAAFVATCIWILPRSRHLDLRASSRISLAWILALCPSLWIHSTSGLETADCLLLTVICWLQTRRACSIGGAPIALLVVTMLLTWSRADGFVVPTMIVAWLALSGHRNTAIAVFSAMVGALALLHTSRAIYFGEFWPNSVTAKVNGGLAERLEFSGRMLGSIAFKNSFLPYFVAVAAAIAIAVRRSLRGRRLVVSLEAWLAAGTLFYYLIVGGDIYRERLLLIVVPLGAVVALRAMAAAGITRFAPILALTAIALQCGASAYFDARLSWRLEFPKYDSWVTLGKYLGENHPDKLLATSAAGKLTYFSGMRCIDTLGLNDKHIARAKPKSAIPGHGRYDPDYVFDLHPDFITDHVTEHADLVFGMPRDTYVARGYELWLLMRNVGAAGKDQIDVAGMDATEIRRIIASGYSWAVLRKRT